MKEMVVPTVITPLVLSVRREPPMATGSRA
jgi:hypothetical protein